MSVTRYFVPNTLAARIAFEFDSPDISGVLRSSLVATPARKSACVVSDRQALGGAAAREKFCVVVPPSVTTMPEAERETNPGLLAVIDG